MDGLRICQELTAHPEGDLVSNPSEWVVLSLTKASPSFPLASRLTKRPLGHGAAGSWSKRASHDPAIAVSRAPLALGL